MKSSAPQKSSFTLPPDEVKRVNRLKKRLGLKSNTAVVRQALADLEAKTNQEKLREAFKNAVNIIQADGYPEMKELDRLSDEGLD